MATKNTHEKEIEAPKPPKGDVWKVPFNQLRLIDGLNVRDADNYGDIEDLAKSIEDFGLRVPLQGYREGYIYYIVDGHRRYAALKLLSERGLDVSAQFLVEPKHFSEEDRIVNMVVTNDGKPLTPLELAEAVKRLLNLGWEAKKIAGKFGKSIVYINKLILLNSTPEALKKEIKVGRISSTFAIQLATQNQVEVYLAGKLTNDEKADEAGDEPKPKKRVTAKNIAKINSLKAVKKVVKVFSNEENKATLPPEHEFLFEILAQIVKNELTEEYLLSIFTKKQ